MKEVRGWCPFCDKVWQTLVMISDQTVFAHYCENRSCWIGWGLNGIPFEIPEEKLEWS